MKKWTVFLGVLFFSLQLIAQQNIELYPTHWYTGMKWNKVQLLVRDKSIFFCVFVWSFL